VFDNNQGPRPSFTPAAGEEPWKCTDCGAVIESLPFAPRKDEAGKVTGLRCRDCHAKVKAARGDRPRRY